MRISPAALLLDARALLRSDAGLLLPLVGLLWFVPVFALQLLVPSWPVPPPDYATSTAVAAAYNEQFLAYVGAYGGWYVLAFAVRILGAATLYALYLERDRPDLRAALARGARLWPRFLLLELMIAAAGALLIGIAGVLFFVAPLIWLLARFLLAGPAIVAAAPVSAVAALGRSWRLTRGATLPLMAVVALVLGPNYIAARLLADLDGWLRARTGGENVVAVAMTDALAAAIGTAAGLASALIAVAAYRALARNDPASGRSPR